MTRQLRQATIIGALAILAAFVVVGRGPVTAMGAADARGTSHSLVYAVNEDAGRLGNGVTRAAGASIDRAESNLRQILTIARYSIFYLSQPPVLRAGW